MTKSAIIVLCGKGVLVWAIPPLLPHSLDHFLDDNPTHLPPLFEIPFPDHIDNLGIRSWNTITSWYFGSWDSIYFDLLLRDYTIERFKLIVKPDLSDASLHVINTFKLPPLIRFQYFKHYAYLNDRICEDTLVSFWGSSIYRCGVYAGLKSAEVDLMYMIDGYSSYSSLCPASGKLVYHSYYGNGYDDWDIIVVVDII